MSIKAIGKPSSTLTRTGEKKYLLFFLLLTVPIFISLDISEGIRFDITFWDKPKLPSLPLSIFLIFILFLFNFRIVFREKLYSLFLLSSMAMTILSVVYGNTRIIVIFLQMNVFLISYHIFKKIFITYDKNIMLDIFFKALSHIVVLKFIFDILYFQTFSSIYFLHTSIGIYNYYDYFPFIYFVSGILSLRNIWYKKMLYRSLLVFVISLICIYYTHSRLFTYSFYLVPLLTFLFVSTMLNKKIIFNLLLFVVISSTILLTIWPTVMDEHSMQSRFSHWVFFFNSFELINFIFPFMNEYRLKLNGSFHNEILEIVSYFGLVSILFFIEFYIIITKETIIGYSIIIKLLIFVLLIGMLVQINLLNPYLSVFIALLISLTHQTKILLR